MILNLSVVNLHVVNSMRVAAIAVMSLLIMVVANNYVLAQEYVATHKWSGKGLRLELAPLSLDLVRAFFIGRDFSAADADYIAKAGCIFRSAIGNSGKTNSDPKISIQLKKWRIIQADQHKPPMTREDWADVWKKRGVDQSPAIAFHWALYPTEQQYSPTDYNWGLISFAMPPGTKFDLEVTWLMSGKRQQKLLKNLECGK